MLTCKKTGERMKRGVRMSSFWTPAVAAGLTAVGLMAGADLAVTGGGAAAQEIACGEDYHVAEGDTLSRIAVRAYGAATRFEDLFRINADTIGDDPSRLRIGMVLDIPCGPTPAPSAATPAATPTQEALAPIPAAVPTTPAAPKRRGGMLRIVTADNWRPYTDETDPDGGMVPDIMKTALSQVAEDDEYQIDFVNDWGAHLDPLIVDGMFDVSFPWVKPDCTGAQDADAEVRFRCERLAWSDPIFEIVSAVYVKGAPGGGAPTETEITGETICLPADHAINGLVRLGFAPPVIDLVRADSPEDCIEAVAEGDAFGTLLTTSVAEDAIQETGYTGAIYEVPDLNIVDTIHAVTSSTHPEREETLALLNAGIAAVRENGQWFEIVQRHLIKHKAKTR